MTRLRRHRLRTRFALLAIVALFWSQLVLAAHPGCIAALAALAPVEAAAIEMSADGNCDHDVVPPEQAVCLAHCSQGDLTSEIARIPPVPPMLASPAISIVVLVALTGPGASSAEAVEAPPPLSWHRPTAHPAALLLI